MNIEQQVSEHLNKFNLTKAPSDRGPAMQTYSGKSFYPQSPRAEDICIEDIAHALSLVNRYNGHTIYAYSVGYHSLLLSHAVSEENALVALMHDATEAYMCDIPSPLKCLLPEYKKMEDELWLIIAEKYGLPETIPKEVKEHDTRIVYTERNFILRPAEDESIWEPSVEIHQDIVISEMDNRYIKKKFLERFKELSLEAA